jgi:hypothetical protein
VANRQAFPFLAPNSPLPASAELTTSTSAVAGRSCRAIVSSFVAKREVMEPRVTVLIWFWINPAVFCPFRKSRSRLPLLLSAFGGQRTKRCHCATCAGSVPSKPSATIPGPIWGSTPKRAARHMAGAIEVSIPPGVVDVGVRRQIDAAAVLVDQRREVAGGVIAEAGGA